MESVFEFGTTARHGRLLDFLVKSVFDLFLANKLINFSESSSLGYYGDIKDLLSCSLIDVTEIQNSDLFLSDTINYLRFVTPDYMHFTDNRYLINQIETRVVGYPNLIVEVLSKGNSSADRQFKKFLYSTGNVTEHWYIEQDSNIVECWYGKNRLNDKNLKNILITQDNIEFDLRYLAL